MGVKSRLHKQAVITGTEKPFRALPLLRCLHCKELFTEKEARPHIRKCWNYPIADNEPIPGKPIIIPKPEAAN